MHSHQASSSSTANNKQQTSSTEKSCSRSSTTSKSYVTSREKKVEVSKSQDNAIDDDFQRLRNNFDDDMRKMDAEMNKFRAEMRAKQRELDVRPLSPSSRKREMSSMMDNFDSPLIQQDTHNDGKTLRLKFDLTDYEPEEIVVKTIDNKLQVHARHEEKSESRSVFREYDREFLLPDGTNPELIRSSLSRDGVLTVEAPLPSQLQDNARRVPISKH